MLDPKTEDFIKKGLLELFKHIQHIRSEIASIRSSGNEDDHFSQMSDELDAIVESTEEATNIILESTEQIDDIIGSIDNKEAQDKLYECTGKIVVACSFQDITGQRVTKVVKSLKYIEERINSMISLWGEKEIAEEKVVKETEKDEYKRLLNGPQLKGKGTSQEDVDEMFNSTGEITKESKENKFFTAEGKKLSKAEAQSISLKMQEEEKKVEDMGQDAIDSLFD